MHTSRVWLRGMGLALALALGSVAPRASAEAPQGVTWERVRDDDGIVVHRREVAGSPIIAFRGEGVIDAPLVRVAGVLVDGKRATEWIDSLKESRQVRRVSPTESITYSRVGTPFPLTDRDMVISTRLEIDPAGQRVILRMTSVQDPAAPPTDAVRAELLGSAFELTSIDGGKRTRVVTEIHCDPKGSVPKWVVNVFQKGWPHNTLVRLRAQVAKPDLRDPAELVAILAQAGFFR